tara:strand:- start:1680 stop:1877 length:198 start_codon:yes stop_codon:yes gene_type:complete
VFPAGQEIYGSPPENGDIIASVIFFTFFVFFNFYIFFILMVFLSSNVISQCDRSMEAINAHFNLF